MSMRTLAVLALPLATVDGLALQANPIRKVVTMLQKMQAKVQAEGEKEKELYEKFNCYCKNGRGDLSASIAQAQEKAPAVSSSIAESEAKLSQSKEALGKAQTDRVAAKDAMAEATGIREKEAAAFAASKSESDTNIAAMNKAVAALEKGMSGSFLQSQAAATIKKLASTFQDLADFDRQELVAFLDGSSQVNYAPQSGSITGILKQMSETMSKDLAEITAAEEEAKKNYGELMAAKTKEVQALTDTVESKTTQIGDLGVAIVQMKEDLSDTQEALLNDQKFLQNLEKSCATKAQEWEERSKTRAEELVALADTIKVLNDDDALDLFKSTLSKKSSFLQLKTTTADARAIVQKARFAAQKQDKPALDLLLLALSGKRASTTQGFDKVVKMIDEMVEVLKREQVDDDSKKEYCGAQFDTADDKQKALERTVSKHGDAIESAKDAIDTLKADIASLVAGIKALDKSVAEATEQRKNENAEYKELMASNTAAKKLMDFAKNRLNKFYNPALYKPPAERQLSREDQIAVNMGGEAPPTTAPGGIAGTGISFVQTDRDAPAAPPATWGAYAKKGEESTGVMAMIDLLIKDLDKEMQEAEVEEKNSQEDYTTMMKESADKRQSDSKLQQEKTSTKAETEGELQESSAAKTSAGKELMATLKYISSLHSECDWLIKYHGVRKEARSGEIDSLKNAKAVLSGADYSFVQTH